MKEKLVKIIEAYDELQAKMGDPAVLADQKEYNRLAKEYASQGPLAKKAAEYVSAMDDLEAAKEMLSDADMKEFAQEEIADIEARLPQLEEDIKFMLIPADPADEKDIIVEIRAAAGGDEAAIAWAREEEARLTPSGRVYIFGGGHVAQALVPALAAVDFRCVVLEDREDFCRPELFPGVEETRLIQNGDPAAYAGITAEDYVAVMTRGHKDDLTVQAQALKTPAKYIGVIGSRKKTAAVFAKLRDMGYTDADLQRITTPIGLSIKAETPAEIAVSIAAQLIQLRAETK